MSENIHVQEPDWQDTVGTFISKDLTNNWLSIINTTCGSVSH